MPSGQSIPEPVSSSSFKDFSKESEALIALLIELIIFLQFIQPGDLPIVAYAFKFSEDNFSCNEFLMLSV